MTLFERAIDSPVATMPSLSVAASPDQLRVLRAFVRAVAIPHALAVGDLDDLILAADEAAATLMSHALPFSALQCTVDIDTQDLRMILAATTSAAIDTSTTSFSWFILQRLVDGVVLEQIPTGAPGNWTTTIIVDKALQAGL
ncbi:ATP-binding protein [Rhodococcus sp. ARC_M6]|uniref:ATP-binding protein n=1 Tax=Rhodococcus sp. ARC_M6 TaxID=2928852 RepID=UPI001FB45F66|nr:ATP-binding protein [Rhodococcus sp. ARC_M6]MCJ0907414.1 ATP-binding protein [Rhodococcus sp. ARC_M6]